MSLLNQSRRRRREFTVSCPSISCGFVSLSGSQANAVSRDVGDAGPAKSNATRKNHARLARGSVFHAINLRLDWCGYGREISTHIDPTGDEICIVVGLQEIERTWDNIPIFSSDWIDLLIAECDDTEKPSSRRGRLAVEYNPFSVFPVISTAKQRRRPSWPYTFNRGWESGGLMPAGPRDCYLFHHYVTHVAIHMMPFDHPLNPWKLYYPSVALQLSNPEEKAMYHALLAHAAFSLAHLSSPGRITMDALAVWHYNASIKHLNQVLQSVEPNHRSSTTLAAIMTLMMAEVYSGQSCRWHYHLQGAWALLLTYRRKLFWNESNFACFSTQSLLIIRIIGATCSSASHRSTPAVAEPAEAQVVSAILSTKHCGFTIGAQQTLLEYACHQSAQDLHDLARYQLDGFTYATYIYLYRTLLDVPPRQVSHYVSLTFQSLAAFRGTSDGNYSLWPTFIAAVEASTSDDLESARAWLDQATSFGFGNRILVRRIVEEVWRRRERLHQETGQDLGLIRVDRRLVADELNIDVLLV
ncbi:fungal specific transcription factor domain-containing protein [Aspergillus clavatus NRRL 1]|uniref:Uncharacterized protein n=1 Tax=Aspergillus clavatus (strain ATCC 1007 / CBS 513.65 / DSM 816 / NCTC 3887 / NRRL 1 / QM 1276 / 107) TaxID=344612 RepID=A1CCX6_ASPCL|nr:uncharacterized protein ACLA_063510 [Aspergillus clavatus NRRL 1]EAW12383.1 hypothetical protein ACLA_063510 [Aspergillus clavatus NRRL 1]